MSSVADRAAQAQRLLQDEAFLSLIEEIRTSATEVFLDANCDIDRISKAHEQVRATQTILDALQERINAKLVKDKKDRHRGND
jgi:hypothetical protein